MSPLKTIGTVKMAWHNRGKRSGTNVENPLTLKELKYVWGTKSLVVSCLNYISGDVR